jgi:hypothetical protein
VVKTSQEAGDLCALKAPGIGDDMNKIAENQSERYLWIWLHDLLGDVAKAEVEFKALVGTTLKGSDGLGKAVDAPVLAI